MSKTKKALKRKREVETNRPSKKQLTTPPSPDTTDNGSDGRERKSQSTNLNTIVSKEELEITVDTLNTLAKHPNAIKAKACRDIRAAVWDFRQACTTGNNATGNGSGSGSDVSLTARISAALVDGNYTDALVLLAEMRIRDESPKLGALCRWVRDLDVTSGLSMAKPETTAEHARLLRVLDAISRVTGTWDLNPSALSLDTAGPLALQKPWDLHDETSVRERLGAGITKENILKLGSPDGKKHVNFRVLETIPGANRRPPNLHDAVLYASHENAIKLSSDDHRRQITHQNHPHVPKLSILRDVLSSSECKAIIAQTEAIGFLPDAPIRDDGAEASVLAHNVYWLIDQSFHDSLWSRVQTFIPSRVEGRKARSINRRFRVYRYVPGAEYRCHFDGAWPPSGIDPKTQKYMYDASPPQAKQSSLFTFLVYLNDDFEGGETTFFTPSAREGVMNVHPVRPVMGSIALFPHGDCKGALLHEGTGVRRGAKYIIRTDVEYDVEPGYD